MNNIKTIMLWVMILTGSRAFALVKSKVIQVKSPDRQLSVQIFTAKNGRLSNFIKLSGTPIIETSALGLTVDGIDLGNGAKIISSPAVDKINENYSLVGNHTTAHNQANEATIPVETSGEKFNLIVRVYD